MKTVYKSVKALFNFAKKQADYRHAHLGTSEGNTVIFVPDGNGHEDYYTPEQLAEKLGVIYDNGRMEF